MYLVGSSEEHHRSNKILWEFCLALVCTLFCLQLNAADSQQKPNIVILLADDLGWNDVGYHGSDIQTPHIDHFASEGVILDRFYVSPWCSPTRAGLMTGRYPHRYGYQYVVTGIAASILPGDAITLAEVLAEAGYERRGYIGKWHLNSSKGGLPLDQGFTEFYGMLGGAVDYFTHRKIAAFPDKTPPLDWFRDSTANHDVGYATDLLGDEAVRFIESSARDQPFFLYVAFNAPHAPLQAKGDAYNLSPDGVSWADMKAYQVGANAKLLREIYTAMVSSMDDSIGRIFNALDRNKLRENTLVLFLSDNGADVLHYPAGENSPLRGGKNSVWEGGVRVPAIIRWPAEFRGGTINDGLMSYVDVLPTLAEIAGGQSLIPKDLDGVSVLNLLEGEQPKPNSRQIYLGAGAIIDSKWKLVGDQLFAIRTDPSETTDLAASNPDIVKALRAEVQRFEEH